jgi:L-lactate dehydrogenase complex protein LldF
MTSTFREKIREKIADNALQAALDGNAERRVNARITAFASLPDGPERRQKAHAIRADVIEHLDEYLAQFIGNAQKNGITVHRAKDAAEAVRLVLEIAAPVGAQRATPLLFAKAKSMVSEEIGLNHALEAAGHRVVETDLGEYIVQLRGERPAHIITPAVHLRRHQVGQLFHEKLGIPYTEDIPTLTNTARAVLREVFLTADIGISGVNFGVAETGTLTIVTNEGNGRMCTTLPPIHIALMGMERLLPTLDDLAMFLSLLPRSATGQKLSVYTQFIHQPLEGQQRHLVIVDNGRSALRASPLAEALYCIRCGSCLNACPVFREIGGHAYLGDDGSIAPYSGPIGSVISPGLMGENFAQLAQASSLCGACKDACPVDIDLPRMLLRIRAGELPDESGKMKEGQGIPGILKLGLSGYSWVAAHPRLFAVSQKLAGWFSTPLPPFISVPAATGWGFSKDMPKPAARPFRERWGSTGKQVESRQVDRDVIEPRIPVSLSTPTPISLSTLTERFTAELTTVGGQVYHVRADELPEKLTTFLRERGLDRVQMWDNIPALTAADPSIELRAGLAEAGIRVEPSAPDPSASSSGQAPSPALRAGSAAGITGVLAGIAETGTLVIPGGAGRPLTASLLPGIHIAVLRAADILPSLEQAIRLPEVASTPATVLVTGPSRTGDIEMTLTIGVHGPKEVHVFIVNT